MKSFYDNIDLSKKIFAKVICSTILDEINSAKSHGQIVRNLIKDGYSLDQAEIFYNSIIKNKEAVIEKINLWDREIKEEQKKYRIKNYLLNHEENVVDNSVGEHDLKEATNHLLQSTPHILLHIIHKILGH